MLNLGLPPDHVSGPDSYLHFLLTGLLHSLRTVESQSHPMGAMLRHCWLQFLDTSSTCYLVKQHPCYFVPCASVSISRGAWTTAEGEPLCQGTLQLFMIFYRCQCGVCFGEPNHLQGNLGSSLWPGECPWVPAITDILLQ